MLSYCEYQSSWELKQLKRQSCLFYRSIFAPLYVKRHSHNFPFLHLVLQTKHFVEKMFKVWLNWATGKLNVRSFLIILEIKLSWLQSKWSDTQLSVCWLTFHAARLSENRPKEVVSEVEPLKPLRVWTTLTPLWAGPSTHTECGTQAKVCLIIRIMMFWSIFNTSLSTSSLWTKPNMPMQARRGKQMHF